MDYIIILLSQQFRIILVVFEYIIVILQTIISLIAIQNAFIISSNKQLIIKVNIMNGKNFIVLSIIFFMFVLEKSINNKFIMKKIKIILSFGIKNTQVLYIINNQKLITFFILYFTFQNIYKFFYRKFLHI